MWFRAESTPSVVSLFRQITTPYDVLLRLYGGGAGFVNRLPLRFAGIYEC
jgi:hypothetical protein